MTTIFEQISERLKGRAASLAQNIELNALTTKLNELANKAGFSNRGGDGNGSGINLLRTGTSLGIPGSSTARVAAEGSDLGFDMDANAAHRKDKGSSNSSAATTSTNIGRGSVLVTHRS